MLILCHPEIWANYFKAGNSLQEETEKIVSTIVNNNQNKFAFFHLWQEYFENSLLSYEDDKLDLVEAFNAIVLELNDKNRLVKELSVPVKTETDFYNCFDNSSQINYYVVENKATALGYENKTGVTVLNEVLKPNKHWVNSSLLCSNISNDKRVDYNDFGSNDEIETFLFDLLNLKNPLEKRIYIQSDYLNFGDIFKKLVGKKITYCTSKYKGGANLKSFVELSNEKQRVDMYFGVNGSYLYSSDKTLLHPRSIVFSNVVVSLNHDFDQILISNKNWHINFHFCCYSFTEKKGIIDCYCSI